MHDPDEGDPFGVYVGVTNPVSLTLQVLDEGKAIFTRECMVCHGDAGRGSGPYRAVIQPGPPDFGDGSYGDYSDADYFWRISEGVPWSAMPSWKTPLRRGGPLEAGSLHPHDLHPDGDTAPSPPDNSNFTYPDFYKESARFPDDVSFERGRTYYLEHCAHCHGYAGDGNGPDGQYLNPTPADFRDMATQQMTPESQGEHLAKVTFGIQDTAMPVWGEWLPLDQRWDVIKFLMDAFSTGMPQTTSVADGQISADYLLASSQTYLDEGHTISVTHGADVYATYCATCHGDNGQGNGPGTVGSASGGPAAFPAQMPEDYVYWRVWEGVPDGLMYPFKWVFTTDDAWDVTTYLMEQQGGAP